MQTLIHALKEWSVAIAALTQGDTILLLRKGGIREVGGRFQVAQSTVLLYPTYEHQQPHLLKPNYATAVQPVASGWHPKTVPIASWAEITHIFSVTQPEAIAALQSFHIWNEQFATERFNWKPSQPLYVLMLRTYRLPQIIPIPYQEAYGGCRSWIDLAEPIAIAGSTPVLSDSDYGATVQRIEGAIAPFVPAPSLESR